jgi:hypothetical protein
MTYTIDRILNFIFSMVVFLMFTYLIFWKDRSAWWYVLAVFFIYLFNDDWYPNQNQETKEKE